MGFPRGKQLAISWYEIGIGTDEGPFPILSSFRIRPTRLCSGVEKTDTPPRNSHLSVTRRQQKRSIIDECECEERRGWSCPRRLTTLLCARPGTFPGTLGMSGIHRRLIAANSDTHFFLLLDSCANHIFRTTIWTTLSHSQKLA